MRTLLWQVYAAAAECSTLTSIFHSFLAWFLCHTLICCSLLENVWKKIYLQSEKTQTLEVKQYVFNLIKSRVDFSSSIFSGWQWSDLPDDDCLKRAIGWLFESASPGLWKWLSCMTCHSQKQEKRFCSEERAGWGAGGGTTAFDSRSFLCYEMEHCLTIWAN